MIKSTIKKRKKGQILKLILLEDNPIFPGRKYKDLKRCFSFKYLKMMKNI